VENVECRLGENKIVGLMQTEINGDVRIFHLNDKGEFVGVAEFTAKEFAEIIELCVTSGWKHANNKSTEIQNIPHGRAETPNQYDTRMLPLRV